MMAVHLANRYFVIALSGLPFAKRCQENGEMPTLFVALPKIILPCKIHG
jgi:hypothetical protein